MPPAPTRIFFIILQGRRKCYFVFPGDVIDFEAFDSSKTQKYKYLENKAYFLQITKLSIHYGP